MTAQMPWQFSEAPAEDQPAYLNLPTPEGRLLGAELARLCDIEEARLRYSPAAVLRPTTPEGGAEGGR